MPNTNNRNRISLIQYYVLVTVDWDTSDTESIPSSLPKQIHVPIVSPFIPDSAMETEVTEYLSNEYGMCINSITIETK